MSKTVHTNMRDRFCNHNFVFLVEFAKNYHMVALQAKHEVLYIQNTHIHSVLQLEPRPMVCFTFLYLKF